MTVTNLHKKNPKLEEMLKKRDEFLANNPQMAKVQEEIELELKKAGKSSANRMAVLHRIMRESVLELGKAYKEIQEDCAKVQELSKDIKDNLPK